MSVMLIIALVVATATTIAVSLAWGRAAGAATCAMLGMLLIPPAMVGVSFLRWPELFVMAGLAGLVLWHWIVRGSPVGWQWVDIVAVAAVLAPAVSAGWISRDPLDALFVLIEFAAWLGVPYLAGRLLITSGPALKRVIVVVVLAVTLYAPLCLIESFGRPALVERVFGLEGPNVNSTAMFLYYWGPSGYRPYVFTDGFFQLIVIQVAAVLLGIALWRTARSGSHPTRYRGLAMAGIIVNLAAVACLSRAWAGVLLPVGALALLGLLMLTRWRVWMLLACLIVPTYIGLRAFEIIPTAPLPLRHADGTEFLGGRGRSINDRTAHERQVLDAIKQQPWIGTGTRHRQDNGTFRLSSKYGIDSRLFTVLVRSGYIGLGLVLLAQCLPPLIAVFRVAGPTWSDWQAQLMIAVAVVLITNVVNQLPNGDKAAVYPLLAGALLSVSRRKSSDPSGNPRVDPIDPPHQHDTEYERWAKVSGMTVGPMPVKDRKRTRPYSRPVADRRDRKS
jgi:hypothetical protein